MGSLFKGFRIGQGGVNLTKAPHQLADDEVTQAQNAEIVENANLGGEGALSKRGGLAVLNSAPQAASVLGIHGLPILTTFTRTLYASLGTADSNTWQSSTNGTSWTDTTTPLRAADNDKYQDETNERASRRVVTFRNLIIYPGNNYTQDTDNPEISVFDGTNALKVQHVGIGPSGNGSPPFAITDILTANGKTYFAIHDPGGTAPDLTGRVLSYNPITGEVKQVLTAFGGGTNEIAGGAPSCLVWYQNQLWVGLNTGNDTNGIGKIVRGHPDVDSTWTSDVTNLVQGISTMCVFKGDLYAGTFSSATTGARIAKRVSTGVTWATIATSGGGAGGEGHYASMVVDSDTAAYCVEYFSGGTDIVHILRTTDGTTWSTSRDVDANDNPDATNPQLPGMGIIYNSEVLYVFKSLTISSADGFIMGRSSGGTWTKRATDNYSGHLAIVVART